MAALNFPPSPSTNQIYSANGKSWRFDGTSWKTFYILNVQGGGTGNTSYNLGDILVGAGTSLYPLPVGSNSLVLTADSTAAFGITWRSTAATGITTLNSLTATSQYFSFGYSGDFPNISSFGETHTFNIPIAGAGATGLVSTSNQTFAGQKTFTSAIIGDLTGTATTAGFANTANYAYQSGYGVTSGFATTSGYSHQAGYAITSGSSNTSGFATTASYAHQSGYGITAGFATTASYSYESGYGITSGFATTAGYAHQSGYGITAGFATTASYSHQSGYGLTAGFATTSANINVVNATSNLAHPLIFGSTASGSGVAVSSNTTISFNPSTFILSTSGLAITAATDSTSSSTGALIVSGGVGIGGSLFLSSSLPSSLSGVVVNNGVITSASWSGSTITAFYGGTGYNTYTKGDILVGAGNTFIKLNVGTDNYVLTASSVSSTGLTWSPTAATGLTTLNGLNTGIQYLAFGYTGTVPNFSSSGSTHTLNIPIAGTGSTGLVSTQAQSFAGIKTFTNAVSITDSTGSGSYTSGALTVTGGVGIGGTLNVQGDLNIQGTFTTINSTTITVADKNIELGVVATPTDLTAEGGGITLRGATNKSINWYSGVGWSSSESLNLASGNTFKINGTNVLSSNALGTGVIFSSIQTAGIITSGTWSATAITALYGGTGLVPAFTVGDILYANTSTTWGRLTANSNSGFVLVSAGSGATPTYVNPNTLSVGFASTATYAYQSGYAITSGLATTSTYSHQSGYAITSGFASTATYSYQSGYGLTSGLATTANYSHQSGYAITSGSSNTSAFATTAANFNISSAVSGLFYPVLSNTASSASGIGASVNNFFTFNATSGAFGATSINILSGQAYSIGGSSVLSATSLGTGVTNSSLTAVGTISTGVWAATAITSFYGGTGYQTYSTGDLLVGTGATLTKLAVGTNNFVLTADNTVVGGLKWTNVSGLAITNINGLTASKQDLAFGYSGTVPSFSSSGSTHTLNIPIAGSGATGLISTLAQTIAGQKTFTSAIIGDLTGTATTASFASTANYAHQAGYAITSGFATTANYSYQSGFGITSGFATTAGYAYQSGYGITSGFATTANYAYQSGYAITSGFATTSSYSYQSGYAITSGLASTATLALTVSSNNTIVNADYNIPFLSGTALSTNNSLYYNPSTGRFNAPIYTGSWAGNTITSFYGGTGFQTYSTGDLLVGAGATLSKLSVGTNNFILVADSAVPGGIKWANVSGFAITNINGLTASKQDLAFGYSGTVPAFSSSGSTHTLNIPIAGTGATGLVSTQAQSFAGIKTFTNAVSITDSTGSGSYTTGALVVTGGVGVGGTLNVQGDLNVQGTFTTINSTTITVADKNIELGVVASPSDLTAQGGGITLRGATDKSINWYSGVGWSSSESFNLASGNTFKINDTNVISSSSLGTGVTNSSLTAVGTITTGVWSATAVTALYGGTGLVPSFTVGDILYANTTSTWGRLTANSNSGYVLVSAGSGATPTYVAPSTLSVGFASTSSYSYQSGYAITAGLATTATYSHQAGYATTSGLATTASYAHQSGYGITAGLATTSTYAHQSGYAITSGSSAFATTATYSHQSGYAITSGFATTATNINVVSATTNTNHRVLFTPASGTASGAAVSTENTFIYNPFTDILSVSGLAVTGSTVSTGSTTGALVVTGGVGIGGTVYAATDLNVGNSAIGRLYFSQATLGSAGTTVIPSMAFIGTTNSPITLSVLADNSLSFDGSSGQLFSINNNLSSGWIFAVNDISGLPLLRANADGTVAMGEFAGNVGVGLSNPSYKLHVAGDTNLSSGYVYRINGTQVLSSTSLGTGVTNSSLTAVGTITTGTWSATAITAFYGGTGYNSYTVGDLLVGAGSTLYKLPIGTNNFVLTADNTAPGGIKWSVAASTGVTTVNSLTSSIQYFATGTSGSGFNISSSGSTHTFNVPIAGTGSTGLVSTLAQSFAGVKTFTNDLVVSSSTVSTSTSTGALTVTGGVGIGGSLFTGTSTADSISGVVLNNGVITSGSWAGTFITALYGGTGYNSYTLGDLLVGSGSTFIKLPVGINSYVLGADSSKPSGVGWTTVTPLTVSDTPPASPKNADLWFNSLDGGLLVYYTDVDTNQWVEIALGSGIDLSQPVHITNATPSTSTSTGALIVDGGVGVAGTVYASSFSINGVYDQISSTLVTSATTANQVALSIDASSFRTAKMVVQVTSGSNYHSQEILMVHDDSLVYMTEYAMVNTGAIGSTFDGDISGGNMRFLVTPTNAVTTYKIACSVMRI